VSPAVSATPLARKLGIAAGASVALVGAPAGFDVPGLPDGARLQRGRRAVARADVVLAFTRSLSELPGAGALAADLAPKAALWVLWPRKAAGHVSDLTDEAVREALLTTGLVDVKVAAVGGDWSGLRFVHRRTPR